MTRNPEMTSEWIIANYENYVKDGCNNIEQDLLDLAKRQKAKIEMLQHEIKVLKQKIPLERLIAQRELAQKILSPFDGQEYFSKNDAKFIVEQLAKYY